MKVLIQIFAIALLVMSHFSQASLIVNGGFEETHVRDGHWAWFESSKVNGWNGSNIEIWDDLFKFSSFEGEQHAELNAHGSRGPFSIFQTFSTDVGRWYHVSFAYAARRSLNESFRFDVLDGIKKDNVLFSSIVDDHEIRNWFTFSTNFRAESSTTTISFTTLNSGTIGNFLDDVTVSSINASARGLVAVPEPQSFVLLSLGLIPLIVRRRKKSNSTFRS